MTKSFFVAWLLDRKLAKVATDEPDGSVPAGAAVAEPKAFSSAPLAPGQIRVLSQTATLTYAAVLARWDERSFLLAPFSRFEDPATDEELKTAFQGGLRMGVLQIWNARTAMTATLRKSWIVGTLPEQDVKDALLLWKWSIGDVAELPERISERTGVPIYRTDDPRLEYRREALENFAAFDAEDDANAERAEDEDWFTPENFLKSLRNCIAATRKKPQTRGKFTVENFWVRMEKHGIVHRVAEEAPLAAAAAPVSSNPRRTFLAEGVPAKLRVEYSRSDKCLVFSVWDGKRRVKSAALDGYSLVLESRTDPVPIRDKSARIPAPAPSVRFVLLNPAGKVVDLKEEGR